MGCRALERATVFSESKELFKFSSVGKNQGRASVKSAMMLAAGELGLSKGTAVSWEGLPAAWAREPVESLACRPVLAPTISGCSRVDCERAVVGAVLNKLLSLKLRDIRLTLIQIRRAWGNFQQDNNSVVARVQSILVCSYGSSANTRLLGAHS